ncbi:MAG: DNA/RNA nuclease SfsA, partial [Paracoccaceae bacterium]|nr:DNA/RNA nuclease SfsA [Paracoccaceae bacterium]
AEFPDSVTARGTKHLGELQQMVETGQRAVMLYLVQRTDCTHFDVAQDIDTAYAAAYQKACDKGVEVCCFAAQISPEHIDLGAELAIMS